MRRLMAGLMALMAVCLCLTGCGSKPEKKVDLAAVMASFGLDEGEMLSLSPDDMLDMYGIQAEDCTQYAAVISKSGIAADEIVLVESPDSAAAARVKQALDARYQAKLNETENYLPEQYAVVKACAVTSIGKFTAMIVSPEADKLTELYEKAVK